MNTDWSQYHMTPKELKNENDLAVEYAYTQMVGYSKHIFMTLNSWIPKTHEEYKQIINETIKYINKYQKLEMAAQWYYEKHGDDGRLHVHGMISNIPDSYYPYGGLIDYISHQFHKRLGKPKLRHSISSNISWAHTNEAVKDYCSKQHGVVNYYVQE